MTPAIKQCQLRNIPHRLHYYQHDTDTSSYGLEAAEKLAIDCQRIFKTLVVITDKKQLAVAVVPVSMQLNCKSMAKALNCKKVAMAEAKYVRNVTGYVLGGVSPLGQKKLLPTVLDSSCIAFQTIYVSGGKRGLELELNHQDLAHLTKAIYACLAY